LLLTPDHMALPPISHRRPDRNIAPNKKIISHTPCGQVPVANPSLNGSKGEGQTLPRGQGLQGRKKSKRPCLYFFPQGRRPAGPVSVPPQLCVISPPRFSSSHRDYRNSPTANESRCRLPNIRQSLRLCAITAVLLCRTAALGISETKE
jgi:hypothetical protein